MCLIQASLKEGVSPAAPLKSLFCIKEISWECREGKARSGRDASWGQTCILREGLRPAAPTGWRGPCSPPWCPHGGAWSPFPPCPLAAAPTVMPGDGAAPLLARVMGWTLDIRRAPMAPGPQGPPPRHVEPRHPNSVQPCTFPFLQFFLASKKISL